MQPVLAYIVGILPVLHPFRLFFNNASSRGWVN